MEGFSLWLRIWSVDGELVWFSGLGLGDMRRVSFFVGKEGEGELRAVGGVVRNGDP